MSAELTTGQDDNMINTVLRAGKASADEVDEYAYPESVRDPFYDSKSQ